MQYHLTLLTLFLLTRFLVCLFVSLFPSKKGQKIQIYNSNTKRAKFNLYLISIEVKMGAHVLSSIAIQGTGSKWQLK